MGDELPSRGRSDEKLQRHVSSCHPQENDRRRKATTAQGLDIHRRYVRGGILRYVLSGVSENELGLSVRLVVCLVSQLHANIIMQITIVLAPETRPNFRNRYGDTGRETFQEKAFNCLTTLFERVPAKRRNFILDVKSCTYEVTQR